MCIISLCSPRSGWWGGSGRTAGGCSRGRCSREPTRSAPCGWRCGPAWRRCRQFCRSCCTCGLRPISYHHGDSDYPADLLSPLLPDHLSMWNAFIPAAPRRAINLLQRGILNDIEGGCYWGFGAPLLAVLAWRRKAQGARVLVGLFVAFWALSLGVYLNLGGFEAQPAAVGVALAGGALLLVPALRASRWGRDVRTFVLVVMLAAPLMQLTEHGRPALVRIPMPFLLFKHLVPLFGRGGMPVRFLLLSQLCLALLAAFGSVHALAWVAARWNHQRARGGRRGAARVPHAGDQKRRATHHLRARPHRGVRRHPRGRRAERCGSTRITSWASGKRRCTTSPCPTRGSRGCPCARSRSSAVCSRACSSTCCTCGTR